MDEELKESREKYWSELQLEEKIERMRKMVKILMREVGELNDTIAKLRKHSHLDSGEIVVKWDADGPRFYSGRTKRHPDEEFF